MTSRKVKSVSRRGLVMLMPVALAAAAIAAGVHLCAVRSVPATGHYIVGAANVGTARAAVAAVGGAVRQELGIIDSVTATLTAAQRARLAARRDIRSVFADAPVKLASLDATDTVADNFNQVSFSNDDGTHRWATPWVETGDDGQPLTGKCAITLNLLSSGRLAFTGSGVRLARRAALPPGAVHATLSFDAQRVSLEAGDFVAVQASRDGGIQWTEVGRIAGPANDGAAARRSFDVSAFISADTTIRFVTTLSPTLLNPDAVYIDNLELRYDSVYAGGVSYPSLAGADRLHTAGITGSLVTVALLDSGYWKHPAVDTTLLGLGRVLAQYDAVDDTMDADLLGVLGLVSLGSSVSTDNAGHGSHLTGIIMNHERTADGRYFGMAPDANLVSVRAFDAQGRGTYASVIRGIDWIVRNKNAYGIRVLNLSLGATPQSHYWDDPLNRAVMQAWKAGIVVVASAGNTGPGPQTITVPGNVPYVITVGAMSDNYTPNDPTDDFLTSFSAAGPTYEGFVKPDVVAPGGHVWSLMPTYATIAQSHPAYQNSGDYFTMSGTSQAAAVVSGAVALLLQSEPGLTPDQVKCKLMASAHPAVTATGELAYSVFQQGSGLVNAYDAHNESQLDCANRGLDIDKDLAGTQHYGGDASQGPDGEYSLVASSGYGWNGKMATGHAYAWNQGYGWNGRAAGNQGYAWNEGAYDWQEGEPWAPDTSPGTTASMSINAWVDQE